MILPKIQKAVKIRNGLFMISLLTAFKTFAIDAFYVGEQFYINGPSYTGIMDAIAWYSDRANDIMISGNSNGASVNIIQYFSGTATIECQYAYHYYVGTKKQNQTGHLKFNVSCKKSKVSISESDVVLAPGETVILSYSNSSGYQIPYPYWEVEDSKIATVDDYNRSTEQKITVKGETPGTTNITFFANSGEENPKCKVTVKDIPATSMMLSPDEVNVNVGKTTRFSVKFSPSNASSKVTWSINDENVATISSGGTIKGVKEGTAVVTAKTDNGLSAKGIVNVSPQPTEVILPSSMTLYRGYSTKLTPTLIPSTATTTYKWRSDAGNIVSIDAAGNACAKSYGKANITVTTENGKQAVMVITVDDPKEELDYRNVTKRIEAIYELINETEKIIR